MSISQKLVILFGILMIVLMVLYPPYTIEYKYAGEEIERFIGYGCFFSPPSSKELYEVISPRPGMPNGQDWHYYKIHIDSYRLGLQIFLIALLASVIIVLTVNNRKKY